MNIDYHVEFDRHWYSVPYELTQQQVEIRATDFYDGGLPQRYSRGFACAVTQAAPTHDRSGHRPNAHQRHMEWTPSRITEWASTVGPSTAQVVDRILASNRHPEQGFRSCLGIIRLGSKYPHTARGSRCHARSVAQCLFVIKYPHQFLRHGLDLRIHRNTDTIHSAPSRFTRNLRGPDYYNAP